MNGSALPNDNQSQSLDSFQNLVTAVAVIFCICHIPSIAWFLMFIRSNFIITPILGGPLWIICYIFWILNSTCNLPFYLWINNEFRKSFLSLFEAHFPFKGVTIKNLYNRLCAVCNFIIKCQLVLALSFSVFDAILFLKNPRLRMTVLFPIGLVVITTMSHFLIGLRFLHLTS